ERRLPPGHESASPATRAPARPPAEPAEAPPPADVAAVAEPTAPATGGGLPRWLLVLLGAAAATVAVGGLRQISWLVAPVLLALVVVIALAPVQSWLLRA